jgi:hypothetical protein
VQHGGTGEARVHPADRQRGHRPTPRDARSSSTVGTAATSTSTTA